MATRLLMRPARGRVQQKVAPKPTPKSKAKTNTTLETAKTVQEIVLTQQQSFELVKIGINVAVSQYVFAREFFPGNIYKTRIYDASDTSLKYDVFMDGSNVPSNFNLNKAGKDIVSFNSLVRGSGHPGVEKLLDWLEFGVAEAVKDRCLAKLQLSLYHKEVAPAQLLEAFTMSFTYDEDVPNIQIATSTSTSSTVGKTIKLGQAQQALRGLVVQVMNNTQNIGGRSDGHKVSMQLVYNQNAPADYEYRGFCAGGTSLLIPEESGTLMGNMDTGMHRLSMKYYNARATGIELLRAATPSTAKCKLATMSNTSSALTHHSSRKYGRSPGRRQSPFLPRDHRASSIDTAGENTQQTTVQWLAGISRRRAPQNMDTQLLDDVASSQNDSKALHTCIDSAEIDTESPIVVCECKIVDDTENLIQCVSCQGWCHSQCYGYRGEEPLTGDFECYECILGDEAYQRMSSLVVRRRAIHYLEGHGFCNLERLGDHINTIAEQTLELVESLRSEGIIERCSETSNQPFRFVDVQKLQLEYFDRSKNLIETELSLVEAPATQKTQCIIGQHESYALGEQNSIHPTPKMRRFLQTHHTPHSAHRSEGSSTMTPSSATGAQEAAFDTSPRIANPSVTSLPEQPSNGKRLGDDIEANACKRRRSREVLADSPFSVRSTY